MNKLSSITILAALLFFSFQSCKKETANKTTQAYTMTAAVGNAPFSASGASSVTATASVAGDGTPMLTISGRQDQIHTLGVALHNYTGNTGTFTIVHAAGGSQGAGTTYAGGGFKASYGQVIITSVTPTAITGTFTFKGDDSTLVSNGQFTANPN